MLSLFRQKVQSRFCSYNLSRDDACISLWCTLSFIGLGTTLVIFGPTLLDLADHVGVGIAELAAVLFARSVGSVIGASGSGFVCDRLHKVSLWLLSTDILVSALLTSVIPVSQNIVVVGVFMFLHGFCLGALDNGVHAILMKIWKHKDTGPIMQLLHFMFAFGAFLSPLISKPFLSDTTTVTSEPTNVSCEQIFNFSVNSSCWNELFDSCNETNSSQSFLSTECDNSTSTDVTSGSNFAFAYWVAVIPLLIVLPPLVYYGVKQQCLCKSFIQKHRKMSEQLDNDEEEDKPDEKQDDNIYPSSLVYKIAVLSLLFTLMAVYVGTEVAFGTYIFAFAVKGSLQFTKQRATSISSLFWGTFSFMRCFAIFVSLLKVPASIMLWCHLGGSFTAALIMFIWKDNEIALWIGSGLLGTSMSAIYPTIMVWMSQHVPPNGKSTGVLGTGAVVGDTLFPLMVGVLLDKLAPVTLIYFTFSAIMLCVVITAVLFIGTKLYLRRWKRTSKLVTQGEKEGNGRGSYRRLQFEEVELSLINEEAEGVGDFDNNGDPGSTPAGADLSVHDKDDVFEVRNNHLQEETHCL